LSRLIPQSCTSENEKDNFLFYIRALCKKQKAGLFTDEVKIAGFKVTLFIKSA